MTTNVHNISRAALSINITLGQHGNRSEAFKTGMIDIMRFYLNGTHGLPAPGYKEGSAEFDAYLYGVAEGILALQNLYQLGE